ncbi:MAG: PEP-CTERM/exosortase system-associated acyltransferase [gamma proteobacterium symbiont of Lucinoma myriamae]|nr:PEP-CTERM/exosortase system-associated acyltransferase [gamma proteobacterium symbiont of Lucinoma myriamae]MCU7831614.1 PEP-CTERM/exosortase system-associated acyltransferase [gamma proteobacterium symbiont of Lucinoma myriamae]
MEAVYQLFDEYFEIIPTVSTQSLPELSQACQQIMLECQKIRYQVYCIEHDFEKPEEHLNQLEQDEYDDLSLHALLQHKPSGDFAATVRLVTFQALGEKGLFPMELHSTFDTQGHTALDALPRNSIAEVSRFAVSKTFRKRLTDTNYHGVSDFGEKREIDSKRIIPHITLGLFKILFQMSKTAEIHYWYAVMEVTLIRLLKRFGFNFVRVGPAVEYHGKRIPCFISVSDALENIKKVQPKIWDFITDNGKLQLD